MTRFLTRSVLLATRMTGRSSRTPDILQCLHFTTHLTHTIRTVGVNRARHGLTHLETGLDVVNVRLTRSWEQGGYCRF
jgi:hypothetical protein